MSFQYLTRHYHSLNTFPVEQFELESAVAVDTEFIRRSTYYPRLGLVQLATRENSVTLDPIHSDVECLRSFLTNLHVSKIMHASRQDVDIFLHRLGVVPKPLIDTQILAEFCGFEANISLRALCHHFFNVTLDKSCQRLDWLKRPLPSKALRYAHDDVQYTYHCYEKLRELSGNKYAWFLEDMAAVQEGAFYQETPETLLKKFKKPVRYLSKDQVVILMKILMARDQAASWFNMAVRHVLSDELCLEMSMDGAPQKRLCKEILEKYYKENKPMGWPSPDPTIDIKAHLLEIISKALNQDVQLPENVQEGVKKSEVLNLQEKIIKIAEAHQMNPSLLARKRDIHAALKDPSSSSLGKGWRASLVGHLF